MTATDPRPQLAAKLAAGLAPAAEALAEAYAEDLIPAAPVCDSWRLPPGFPSASPRPERSGEPGSIHGSRRCRSRWRAGSTAEVAARTEAGPRLGGRGDGGDHHHRFRSTTAGISAGPPPEDDRALAERHRAGRARLSHLRQLLAVLDWAAAHLPEPEPEPVEEPLDGLDDPFEEPDPYVSDYDGSEDEFHYGGEVWAGSQETPEFRAWLEDKERRFGPVTIGGGLGGPIDCHVSGRKFVGKLPSPEYTAWHERQHRRTEASLARTLARVRNAGPDRRQATAATPPHDKT